MSLSEGNTERKRWRSALPWALGSLVCSYASGFMQWLYGHYHWSIVFSSPRWQIPDQIREPLFGLFNVIDFHEKLFAAAATGLAVVCVRHRPRWIGIAVLIPALLLLFTATMLMT